MGKKSHLRFDIILRTMFRKDFVWQTMCKRIWLTAEVQNGLVSLICKYIRSNYQKSDLNYNLTRTQGINWLWIKLKVKLQKLMSLGQLFNCPVYGNNLASFRMAIIIIIFLIY